MLQNRVSSDIAFIFIVTNLIIFLYNKFSKVVTLDWNQQKSEQLSYSFQSKTDWKTRLKYRGFIFSTWYCKKNQKSNPKDKDRHVTTIQDRLDGLSFFSRRNMKVNFEAVLFDLYFYYQNLLNNIWAAFVTENCKILSNIKAELRNRFVYV